MIDERSLEPGVFYWLRERHEGAEDRIGRYEPKLDGDEHDKPGFFLDGWECKEPVEAFEIRACLGKEPPVIGSYCSPPPLKAAIFWLHGESTRFRREGDSPHAEAYLSAALWLNRATGSGVDPFV